MAAVEGHLVFAEINGFEDGVIVLYAIDVVFIILKPQTEVFEGIDLFRSGKDPVQTNLIFTPYIVWF